MEQEREQEQEQLSRHLKEREKELHCLYQFAAIIEQDNASKKKILSELPPVIAAAWQYSDVACARIVIDGEEFRTQNFNQTQWSQAVDLVVDGQKRGCVEVCYTRQMPEINGTPFLAEEWKLLNMLSERLGRVIERVEDKIQIEKKELYFRELIEQNADAMICVDEDGIIQFANQVAQELFSHAEKIEPGEMFGYPVTATSHAELTIPQKNNEIVFVDMRVTDAEWQGKKTKIISLRDITRMKKLHDELQSKIHDLESFKEVTLGRESRMIELKKEVNALRKELGLDEKYREIE
jgi:PAS domain-containing protein